VRKIALHERRICRTSIASPFFGQAVSNRWDSHGWKMTFEFWTTKSGKDGRVYLKGGSSVERSEEVDAAGTALFLSEFTASQAWFLGQQGFANPCDASPEVRCQPLRRSMRRPICR
jgi:hypothetical protein